MRSSSACGFALLGRDVLGVQIDASLAVAIAARCAIDLRREPCLRALGRCANAHRVVERCIDFGRVARGAVVEKQREGRRAGRAPSSVRVLAELHASRVPHHEAECLGRQRGELRRRSGLVFDTRSTGRSRERRQEPDDRVLDLVGARAARARRLENLDDARQRGTAAFCAAFSFATFVASR
jgi:hypothetical protein